MESNEKTGLPPQKLQRTDILQHLHDEKQTLRENSDDYSKMDTETKMIDEEYIKEIGFDPFFTNEMDVDGFMALPKEDSLRFQKMFMLQHFQQFIPVFDILTRQFKITSAQNSLLLRSLQANDQRLSLILSEIENLKRQNVELANQNNALLSHNVQLQQEYFISKT